MPYGTVTDYQPRTHVEFSNTTTSGTKVYDAGTWLKTFPTHAVLNYSRSGKNASGKKGGLFPHSPGTLQPVVVRVVRGPRLPYKVYSSRLKKYVWAREPIRIYGLKRVRSKQKAPKGLDLAPNPLDFAARRVSFFGGDGSGNGTFNLLSTLDSRNTRRYTGALWTSFLIAGGTTASGPSVQNYITSAQSPRFSEAVAALAPKVLTKLYSDVKNQQVNFAQALAERNQTASLVVDLTKRLVSAVMKARHGNIAGAASILFPKGAKGLANDWLVLQYGINPLISDIKGCVSLLSQQPTEYLDVTTSRTIRLPRERIFFSSSMGGQCETSVYSQGFVTVKYKVRVKVSDPFGQFLSDTGFSDVAALGYELTPYSFLLDWLIPVGNYLTNLGAFANLEVVSLHRTDFRKEIISYERRFIGGKVSNGFVSLDDLTVGFQAEKISCRRSIITDGVPKLPYPSLKDPVSAGHIANAIALVTQLLKFH